MKVVKASSDLLNFFKRVSNTLFGVFNKLVDIGLSVDDVKQKEDGSVITTMTTGSGKKLKVRITPVGDKDLKSAEKCDIDIKTESGKVQNYKNIINDTKSIQDKITDFVDKEFGEGVDDFGDVESSTQPGRHMKVVLKKVTSSEGISVMLEKVLSDYSACEALRDITALVDNDEFLEALPADTAIAYDVTDTGTEYDVCPCEEFSVKATYLDLLKAAYCLMMDIQTIHWNAHGEDFRQLHNETDNLSWNIRSQVDTLAELCVEYGDSVPNPATLVAGTAGVYAESGYTLKEGYALLKELINAYAGMLELYSVNVPADVRSIFDSWVREWKKEANYLIQRELV